jgi:ATP-dependent DNA helicase RecG
MLSSRYVTKSLQLPRKRILEYLGTNVEINNSIARKITFIGSENAVKRIFNKMIEAQLIERIPDRPLAKTGYRRGKKYAVKSKEKPRE